MGLLSREALCPAVRLPTPPRITGEWQPTHSMSLEISSDLMAGMFTRSCPRTEGQRGVLSYVLMAGVRTDAIRFRFVKSEKIRYGTKPESACPKDSVIFGVTR